MIRHMFGLAVRKRISLGQTNSSGSGNLRIERWVDLVEDRILRDGKTKVVCACSLRRPRQRITSFVEYIP